MDPLDDIVKEFLIEGYENLDRLDHDLMALEEVPDDRNRLSSVFRAIHTIKGTSGFLAFNKLERVTHVGESLLVLLRDGKIRLNSVIATSLLGLVDAVRKIMTSIEAGNGEGEADYSELMATLERLQVTGGIEPDMTAATSEARRASLILDAIAEQVEMLTNESAPAGEAVAASSKKSRKSRRKKAAKNPAAEDGNVAVAELDASFAHVANEVESTPVVDVPMNPSQFVESIAHGAKPVEIRSDHAVTHEIHPKNEPFDDDPRFSGANDHEGSDKSQTQSVSDSSVRIDVALLDRLMNLVGELVLARNQILQCSRSTEDPSLLAASQRLNLITSELQEGVMKTRMQPIQNAWAKLPRIVRDLSMTCGKKVQLKMEGAETELDKTILEAIRDPLTHIVRNSVDHGIEAPSVRESRGKAAEGTLMLRAFHEGGQVNIEITDDGGGINLPRVKEKAISQGLITADQAATMSDRELMNLILLPGFSTAAAVTNISGRGVGMDVVKTNVEKIGGTLDIQSVYGQGTTLRIKIPLTLAIVPALMVSCGDDRYAIPQNSLVELVRLESDRVQQEIEHIHGTPVYRLRGNLLPLLYLDEQLQLRPTRSSADLKQDQAINIVVLNAENRQFGLVVDGINDTQEIVVKPLGTHLKKIEAYAGVTIMGDGAVALILDVLGIAKQARVVSNTRDRSVAQAELTDGEAGDLKQTLLLLGMGAERRMAIPLSVVARLEEIPISTVERADNHQVVQYGGQIMPLIHLGEVLPTEPDGSQTNKTLQVVVFTLEGRSVGLVVDQILDIVETALTVQQTGKRAGVVGSAIIQNRVTDLLDIHKLLSATDNDYFAPAMAV